MISPSAEQQIRERLEQWHVSRRPDADERISGSDPERIEMALNEALSEDGYSAETVLLFSHAPADIDYLLTLLASLSQELERIRTENQELLSRSGKPDGDRDFSIHAPADTDDTERCPRCGSERVRVIHELFGAGPRNYCDDCKDIWAIQAPSIYWAHDEPKSDDAVARPDGDTLDGLRAQNSNLRRALTAAEQSLETVKGERDRLDIERAELEARLSDAQQWIDSEPEWKARYIAIAVEKDRRVKGLIAKWRTGLHPMLHSCANDLESALLRERPQEPHNG